MRQRERFIGSQRAAERLKRAIVIFDVSGCARAALPGKSFQVGLVGGYRSRATGHHAGQCLGIHRGLQGVGNFDGNVFLDFDDVLWLTVEGL